jgi:[NiFe] hydrogenase diaphorase moiety small subunit
VNDQASFWLDGREIPFRKGETIMDAALRAGAYIPHLCHHPELVPVGSCRICVVGINGRARAACTHPAAPGLRVDNGSEQIRAYRRGLLQMLFVEGNHVCPGCEKSGDCQLQALAYYCGMLAPELPHQYPRRALDASHPATLIDFDRCILCGLCVRASGELDHKGVFSIAGRGADSRLIVDAANGHLGSSRFAASDRAASICPVGAILPKFRGYEVPIGERRYDRRPIGRAGNVEPEADPDG